VHLVQDDAGRILPDMKQLLATFPDRFMVGTDTAHTAYVRFYQYRIDIFRVMLVQLEPDAARKIGVENARRVFARLETRR
jgi:predicted TIM-barrel fold metal-dependent hydrolase